jgi:hypothetical protein
VYALPVLRQVKMHLSIDDMFTTECPDENVKKFVENYGQETFMPLIISTLETICLGMLDVFKKRFAARNKLIKEVINVSSKEAKVIAVDNKGHRTKRNNIKRFNMCVTAMSTPSKRVFSDSGLALTAKRSTLKSNVLRDQVMIRRDARYLSITEDDIQDKFLKIK